MPARSRGASRYRDRRHARPDAGRRGRPGLAKGPRTSGAKARGAIPSEPADLRVVRDRRVARAEVPRPDEADRRDEEGPGRRRNLHRSTEPAGSARPAPAGHRPASRPGLPAVHRDDLLRRVRQRVLSADQQEPQGRVPLLQLRMPPAERPGRLRQPGERPRRPADGADQADLRRGLRRRRLDYRRRHRGSPEVDAVQPAANSSGSAARSGNSTRRSAR